ncbi:MAG: adenylosuccinate lyase [Flammeovirgaceae bacterium]|nr:adenylosuccinate lyase [Flammeovirgaceae bacterium]MBE60909.1 adenylosuccinate lyase [Flammeovirgaceae bacterium]MBR09261.1 adenylosuccinate lyase [Rickettsiales bacterium]|tara:strand:+ start:5915 stop:7258 length:1344 start_codon:yes stop_codon:yes gene_type:complete
MQLNDLTAISPVDGRYRSKVASLAPYFSEYALIKYRVKVEVLYFIALCEIPLPQLKEVNHDVFDQLKAIYEDFSEEDALKIKDIEKVTNHDVKAVEYFIKEQFDKLSLSEFKEFIHFGLTSQDINNTSIPLSTKDALEEVFIPFLKEINALIESVSKKWDAIPMLAKTHGQPASPTRLGKEIEVFVSRLSGQMEQLDQIIYAAKFGGATGNFNAHFVAYPDHDWHAFGNQFVSEKLGLTRSFPTTQIEHYDHFAALFDVIKRINTILLDFSKDVWQYVAMNYFKQKINPNEVGSSAMPHKVNPIDFENAEGNLGIANAFFEHLSAKLPISRLQRDLTDSTVLRNVGVPFSHTLIALASLKKGINKLEVNEEAIRKDLDDNWAVAAEAIQTILRREAYPNPYEALKALTRTGDKITKDTLHTFISGLDVSEEIKEELMQITPFNYTGK